MLQGIKTEKPATREVKLAAMYDETGTCKEEVKRNWVRKGKVWIVCRDYVRTRLGL